MHYFVMMLQYYITEMFTNETHSCGMNKVFIFCQMSTKRVEAQSFSSENSPL